MLRLAAPYPRNATPARSAGRVHCVPAAGLLRGRRDRQGCADRKAAWLVGSVGIGDYFPLGAVAISLHREIPIGIAGDDYMAAFGRCRLSRLGGLGRFCRLGWRRFTWGWLTRGRLTRGRRRLGRFGR